MTDTPTDDRDERALDDDLAAMRAAGTPVDVSGPPAALPCPRCGRPFGEHILLISKDGSRFACPSTPSARASVWALLRVAAALEQLEAGDDATRGRDFGRGVAHAARVIRAAMEGADAPPRQ